MKVTPIITAIVCAEAAFGARFTEKRRENREARQPARRASNGATRSSQPLIISESILKGVTTTPSTTNYSSNWAGAVLVSTGFTEVTGTITVPTLAASSNDSVEYAGAAWVGIDGDTCQTAILQTGIDWYVNGSAITYDAWYEWWPDDSYNFDGISISAGDSIKMTVKATSTTSGKAVIENLTTGTTVTQTFSDVTFGSLCQENAEWIIEDFSECIADSCDLVPFADFGTVTFTDASAVKSGSAVSLKGATIFEILQDELLTSCSASSSTVTCTYIG
ncbi:peptidase A4 family protein [Diaporthe helianthi]|uniref:Peptidase A4 family protein n=1 Tax=Diaporthe helianthi TaxID=158607 RepID=A0A2P5IBI3_DIAHE|nr:peptidase A4 family protein [Diaporthe helianthi]